MRLFGVDDIFKGDSDDFSMRVEGTSQTDWRERMEAGSKALKVLEDKFINDIEPTDEDFENADQAIDRCGDIISKELHTMSRRAANDMHGAPEEIISMMLTKFIGDIYPYIASMENSKAMVRLLKTKYNKLDEEEDEDEEDENAE